MSVRAGDALLRARPMPPERLQAPAGSASSPAQAVTSRFKPGATSRIGAASGSRDGLLYVPATYDPARPSPLIIMLHGACASGQDCASVFLQQDLDAGRVIVMLPDSRGRTWDMIRDGFGPDVQYIDSALSRVFDSLSIDPKHVACAGFSDGASYALSLGLPNGGDGSAATAGSAGGLFTHLMAFSPGFMSPPSVAGSKPRIYISHGVGDEVLPIGCSRRIVPRLHSLGFAPGSRDLPSQLVYSEFAGGHSMPSKIVSRAFHWFLGQ